MWPHESCGRFFSVMYTTYILQSETTGGYYCGHTEDLERRLRQHNDPDYPFTRTTKRIPGPWRVVWQSASSTRREAMALERRIKKQGRSFF